MTRRPPVLVLAAVLMALGAARVGAPAPARAAETVAAASIPIEVQFWPSEEEGALLLVSAEAPQDAALPYEMRLPLPDGARVVWVGEITGGGPETDVERPHAIQDGNGGKVLVFTVTKARLGQYEARLPGPTEKDGRSTAGLDWVQAVPAGTVAFSVKFSATTDSVETKPAAIGAPRTNQAGERLYTLPTVTLGRGAKYAVTASFVRTTGVSTGGTSSTGASASAGGGSTPLLAVLGGLLALAVAALAWLVLRSRGGSGAAAEAAPPSSDIDDPRGADVPDDSLSDEPFDLD